MNQPGENLVTSAFGQYLVTHEHVEVLNTIFQEYPEIDNGFLSVSISVRSFFIQLLAETALAVEAALAAENIPEAITVPEVVEAVYRVKDIEREGFDLMWLRNKIETIRGQLNESFLAVANEANQRMAQLNAAQF
ncbi:hypothetical protein V6N13_043859 [Hibiscus sabdariffa]|uniref:Uncharacterized protein n=1 Tax=Hibiscus sabdariffa TaxID=183260 RepID=A0ABR2RGS9_9ROSI